MTFDEQLIALMERHNLGALSLHAGRRADGSVFFHSYAHDMMPGRATMGEFTDGVSEAYASAITKLNAIRNEVAPLQLAPMADAMDDRADAPAFVAAPEEGAAHA